MAINLAVKESQSLPPQVIGKVRGILIFKINEIILNRTPTALIVHLQWWGEKPKNYQVLGPIQVTKKSTFQSVTLVYNICTSQNLFHSYLLQSEPIKVEIFTSVSNLKIGTSFIHIPEDLHDKSQNQATSTYKIFNEEGNILGELQVNFEIVFQVKESLSIPDDVSHIDINKYDAPSSKITSDSKFEYNKKLRKTIRNSKHGMDNTKQNTDSISHLLKEISDQNNDNASSVSSTELAVSSRQNVLNFLHGEDMSPESEKQALKDIRTLSPASSLIALADAEHCLTKNVEWSNCPSNIGSKYDSISNLTRKDDSVVKYLAKNKLMSEPLLNSARNAMDIDSSEKLKRIVKSNECLKPQQSTSSHLLEQIDSVRVTVQTLTLSRAGLRIVLGLENLPLLNISPQVSFFIEYSMPDVRSKEHFSNLSKIRICAKSKGGQDIPFNRQSVHKLPLAQIYDKIENPEIVFSVFWRRLSHRQSQYLGQCRITLNEILATSKLQSNRKCPVITSYDHSAHNSKDSMRDVLASGKKESKTKFSDVIGFGGILAGHLTVKVELGCGLLHFGKHFLDSYAENRENISLPSTVTESDTREQNLTEKSKNNQTSLTKLPHNLQERCLICREHYSNKNQQSRPKEHPVLQDPGKNKFSYTKHICDCNFKSAKKVDCGILSNGLKMSSFFLNNSDRDPDRVVKYAEDVRKVPNYDLRGGKDVGCSIESMCGEKRDVSMKSTMKTSVNLGTDEGCAVDVDIDSRQDNDPILLHGLLFVNEAKGLEPQVLPQSYCLINRGFSPGTGGCSKNMMCEGRFFQYLETFPLLCNRALMERCHSGHLILEIWLKGAGPAQKLVGVASLPLHAFFVAYHDPGMVRYLEQVKLPVISVDGWIPLLSPISGIVSGEIQVLLAVGTEKQLEELCSSRNLKSDTVQMSDQFSQKAQKSKKAHLEKSADVVSSSIGVNTSPMQMKQFATSVSKADILGNYNIEVDDSEKVAKIYNSVQTQTPQEETVNTANVEQQVNGVPYQSSSMVPLLQKPISNDSSGVIPLRRPRQFGMLSTFVEQLMHKLPESDNLENAVSSKNARPKYKQTSDLLDELNRALEHSPGVNVAATGGGATVVLNENQNRVGNEVDLNRFKALIEIDQALHLPTITTTTKKCNKRTKCKSRQKDSDVAPSTYVTFQATGCRTVDAPEGPVVATNVVANSCSPVWCERFEVELNAELLNCESKNLVFKVWRKPSSAPTINATPTPCSDTVIGFAVVDLSTLISGLPSICGWFNITDVSRKCNGQIKISITPLESISRFIPEESYCCSDNDTINSLNSTLQPDDITLKRIISSKQHVVNMLQEVPRYSKKHKHHESTFVDYSMNQNSGKIEVEAKNATPNLHASPKHCLPNMQIYLSPIQPIVMDDENLNTTSLSRVLKRKFTELNEITQRLRSRLLDVTSDEIEEDEFERDLNTEGDEQELNVRPEDFQTIAENVVAESSPKSQNSDEQHRTFENLASDYQTLLAGKQSVNDAVCNLDVESMHRELEKNREILSQKKCNIQTLLQKLTLLAHPPVKTLEKHVKFDSEVNIQHSSNIFDLVSDTDFENSSLNKNNLLEESSIESAHGSNDVTFIEQYVTPMVQETENIGQFIYKSDANIPNNEVRQSEGHGYLQNSDENLASSNIGLFGVKDSVRQFENRPKSCKTTNQHDSVNSVNIQDDFETRSKNIDSMNVESQIGQFDERDSSDGDIRSHQSVEDVIANILRMTSVPSSSKDTGLGIGPDEDCWSISKKSDSSTTRKDNDTTGADSDCYDC